MAEKKVNKVQEQRKINNGDAINKRIIQKGQELNRKKVAEMLRKEKK